MDDFDMQRRELVGTIQDLNDKIAHLKKEYEFLTRRTDEIKKLKVQEEKMKLQLSIAKTQEELNKYAPSRQFFYRCTCPSCRKDIKLYIDSKYFSEEG